MGIVALLNRHLPDLKVGTIEDDVDLFINLKNFQPQLIIITLGFKDVEISLSTLMRLRSALPDVPIIVYDTYPSFENAIAYIRGPASGYLSRDDTDNELITCIESILKGKLYICKSVHYGVIDHLIHNKGFVKYKNLTPSEMEMAKHFAQGLNSEDIVGRTRLKLSTIRVMKSKIYMKLHVQNEKELRDRLVEMKAI